jgi:hypothetical protein
VALLATRPPEEATPMIDRPEPALTHPERTKTPPRPGPV